MTESAYGTWTGGSADGRAAWSVDRMLQHPEVAQEGGTGYLGSFARLVQEHPEYLPARRNAAYDSPPALRAGGGASVQAASAQPSSLPSAPVAGGAYNGNSGQGGYYDRTGRRVTFGRRDPTRPIIRINSMTGEPEYPPASSGLGLPPPPGSKPPVRTGGRSRSGPFKGRFKGGTRYLPWLFGTVAAGTAGAVGVDQYGKSIERKAQLRAQEVEDMWKRYGRSSEQRRELVGSSAWWRNPWLVAGGSLAALMAFWEWRRRRDEQQQSQGAG